MLWADMPHNGIRLYPRLGRSKSSSSSNDNSLVISAAPNASTRMSAGVRTASGTWPE